MRTVKPANEFQRSACARAAGDCRATEQGRLAESRAVDETRGSLGAEVQDPPEVVGIPDGRRADRLGQEPELLKGLGGHGVGRAAVQ